MAPPSVTSVAAASSTGAAMSAPSGNPSNFGDPESLVKYSNATIAVCSVLVTVFFPLRCFVRIRYKGVWNLEDWLILISWIGTIAFMGLLAKSMTVEGGNQDFANIISCEYAVAICATKVAILWFYRRVFSSRKGSMFEIACFILIAVNTIYYLATLIAKTLQCAPIPGLTQSGTCTDFSKLLIADGAFNTITDLIILFMPAIIIYRLQMETRKKVTVFAIFTLGFLAPLSSIIGLYMRVKYGREDNVTWHLPRIVFWSGAEITIGTICVCLPELGLLINRPNADEAKSTQSVLAGAREAVTRSRLSLQNRLSQGFGRGWSDSETDTEGRQHWYGSGSSQHTLYKEEEDPDYMPEDAIHVHTDFHIASQVYSKKSVQNMREAYEKMHGKWPGA